MEKAQRSLYKYLHKEVGTERIGNEQGLEEARRSGNEKGQERVTRVGGEGKEKGNAQKDYDLVNIRRRIMELGVDRGEESHSDDSSPKITFLDCVDTQDQGKHIDPNEDINFIELEYERPIVVMKTPYSNANRGTGRLLDALAAEEPEACPNSEGISRSRLAEASERLEIKVEENPDPVHTT